VWCGVVGYCKKDIIFPVSEKRTGKIFRLLIQNKKAPGKNFSPGAGLRFKIRRLLQ